MSTTLDGNALFDEQGLVIEVGSPARECLERSICGLDGMMSIDLGERSRRIRQKGVLHAQSRAAMQTRIASIAACIDGGTHTLRTADGQEYRSLRMDAFVQIDERVGGPGIAVEYEITYTQLGA
jgi:hypothetical protein